MAGERYRQDKSRKKFEHFGMLVEEARVRLKGELHARLEEIWLSDEGASESRRQVAKNLLANLQVHPLSAPEYAKLVADDEDDPSFLKQLEQTGLPTFVGSLEALVADRRGTAQGRLRELSSVFREQVTTNLRLIEAKWEGDGRAAEEAARLREELEVFIRLLREELANRQRGYRAFLKKNIPQRIADLIETAKAKASKDIDRYLARLYIHDFYKPPRDAYRMGSAKRRAAGWRCAQALQWATSSPHAGLGYLVRQAISSRAGGEGINLQVARRLVHIDVPWNPMDMEQRVGRVHRFGSRQTVIVDTVVVKDSREADAYRIAREKLRLITSTIVERDRFKSVFSRVMCLLPQDELQSVLLNEPVTPFDAGDENRLSEMIQEGFRASGTPLLRFSAR